MNEITVTKELTEIAFKNTKVLEFEYDGKTYQLEVHESDNSTNWELYLEGNLKKKDELTDEHFNLVMENLTEKICTKSHDFEIGEVIDCEEGDDGMGF